MPTPANRTPIRPARGLKADLQASLADLQEGELVFAEDENTLYVCEGTGLAAHLVVAASGGGSGGGGGGGLMPGNGVSTNTAREILTIDTGSF